MNPDMLVCADANWKQIAPDGWRLYGETVECSEPVGVSH